jgi:hypothetical protein
MYLQLQSSQTQHQEDTKQLPTCQSNATYVHTQIHSFRESSVDVVVFHFVGWFVGQ